ncbi:hypothetical protein [Methylobacterium oryzae]|uniref:hypothetical protein n=1 Tax=Methylobacterium oryzae TaxID=334852 RepID=UPI001F469A7B|nr:hypothetical protein [Methylobacterium oryzae]UIN38351.1 hypothetical protein LXM90_30685 [Methylobacterium oryzae]
MATMECKVRIRQAWWVRPYIRLARFNASLGIPVDPDRLVETILKHGISYELS